jgi:elongation factor Ts
LLCETDFVSKNDSFLGLVDQIIDMIGKESQDISPDAVPETLLDGITTLLKDNAVKIGENMKPAYIIKRTGTVAVYNHMGNNLSSAVFYSGDAEAFAKDCTLQVAAMNPLYISVDNVDKSRIDALTQEFTEEMSTVDKPADIKNKIIE